MIFWLIIGCTATFEGLAYEAVIQGDVEQVRFESSTFQMGFPDVAPGPYGNSWKENQQPQRTVSLSTYSLDKTEVTVSAYVEFLNDLASSHYAAAQPHYHPLQPLHWEDGFSPQGGKENHPMNYVSWGDAMAYCAWKGGTLPTEAQWERAAKGDDMDNPRPFPWADGGHSCEKAVYFTHRSLCEDAPAPVGSRPKGDTPEGLNDMGGNVSEWVFDWYDRYTNQAETDPVGPNIGVYKILRGGGFRETPDALRTTDRVIANPLSRSEGIGFRCASIK